MVLSLNLSLQVLCRREHLVECCTCNNYSVLVLDMACTVDGIQGERNGGVGVTGTPKGRQLAKRDEIVQKRGRR